MLRSDPAREASERPWAQTIGLQFGRRATEAGVLVLNDPLRGVDANTKEELYELFRRLAGDGLAIVFVSTEILELLVACDRIGVFHAGRLEAMLDAAEATETAIVAAMFGHGEAEREEAVT